jgi:hypothetical protein
VRSSSSAGASNSNPAGERNRRRVCVRRDRGYRDAGRHRDHHGHADRRRASARPPPEAIARAKDTATNPSVLSAFALAIVADGQEPAYPEIAGHEPRVEEGRKAAERIDRCVNELRAVAPNGGAYVSESNYFEKGWQQAYWGSNYPRLAEIKRKYEVFMRLTSGTVERIPSSRRVQAAVRQRRLSEHRNVCAQAGTPAMKRGIRTLGTGLHPLDGSSIANSKLIMICVTLQTEA